MATPTTETPYTSETGPAVASVFDLATAWLAATARRIGVVAELAVAETRLAAVSGAAMLLLTLCLAFLLIGAWGLAMAGTVMAAWRLGIPVEATLATLAVVHTGLALCVWHAIKHLSRNLEFRCTREQLALAPDAEGGSADGRRIPTTR